VFDGGSRGNPGEGYGSFTYKGLVVRWQTGILYPGKTTNNQAEYMTLIAGLRSILFDCQALGLSSREVSVEVRSDSQLVVNQVNGRWKIKNAELRKLQIDATKLLGQFAKWELGWHPRSESVRILGH
jgi:ribonuclease HI